MTTTSEPQPSALLEPAQTHVTDAIRAIINIRWLLHAHSSRPSLVADEANIEYLLHARDEAVRHLDAAVRSYAEAVDPTGAELACVTGALAEPMQAECKPFYATHTEPFMGTTLEWPVIGVYVTEV